MRYEKFINAFDLVVIKYAIVNLKGGTNYGKRI